jgi:hypothetical protein
MLFYINTPLFKLSPESAIMLERQEKLVFVSVMALCGSVNILILFYSPKS